MAGFTCVLAIIGYVKHFTPPHTLFPKWPLSLLFSIGHSSLLFNLCFISLLPFSPPFSFYLFLSKSLKSNPFPSPLRLPFHSLALPPFTCGISQMAYSNWNLPFCQDKKTSVSPKHYTIKLKFDGLLHLVSITVLLLFYLSFSFIVYLFPLLAFITSLSLRLPIQLCKVWLHNRAYRTCCI